jgi:hypothetical protein
MDPRLAMLQQMMAARAGGQSGMLPQPRPQQQPQQPAGQSTDDDQQALPSALGQQRPAGQLSAPPVQGQMGQLGVPGAQQPGMLGGTQGGAQGQPPGSQTPEQAAAARFDMLRRAQQMPGQNGMFDGISPSGPNRANNMFAAAPDWYSGIFNTTNKLTPFDSFYVDNSQAQSWL